MELGDYKTFCSESSQVLAQRFIASLKYGDAELAESIHLFIQGLGFDAELFRQQIKFDKAEQCYTLALKAIEILAKQKRKLSVPTFINEAVIWSYRSIMRYEQGKYYDAFKDAENSVRIDSNYTKGYWAACLAQKALSDYPKAAYFLILALSRNRTDDFVMFISELAILVSQIKAQDKEEFMKYKDLAIITTTSLDIWIEIIKTLSDRNEFEAIAILTTGVCESCCVSSSVVHNLASKPGLSFGFLNVGRILTFLADKEGTKSWHLKLAEFVAKRGANLLTVEQYFKKPFFIAMTTLSVEGGLPSFLSLAWNNLSPQDYDQKDSQGNTALHIVTKHGRCTKQISEIICRELLGHGCLPTELDGAGKRPHEYIPPGHTSYKLLTDAIKTPEKSVRERVELIRKDGNNAFTGQQCDRAIQIYQKALYITSKFSALQTEAAVLHSNISAVYLKKEAYVEAAVSAENSLKADPKFAKGYFRKGQALSKMGNYIRACEAFISGFHQTNEDSMKMNLSNEAAKILLYIPDANSSLLKEMKQVISYKWSEKIKYFTQNVMWAQVNSLFLGPPYENNAINAAQIRTGIMAKSDASQAVLSTIFQALGHSEIDAPALITLLLQQGASSASLASSKETTYFHAAIRFCILTSNIQILKFILVNDTEKNIQTSKDSENRTPLHTLCIESDKRTVDVELCVKIAMLLAERKVDFNAKDKYQRSAADYVISRSELKKKLESIKSNLSKHTKDQKPAGAESTNDLKEKGNAAFKNAKYKEAYQFYSQAIMLLEVKMHNPHEILSKEDGRSLAILYGNRAECLGKQGENFLEDAKKSVDADGSWYKGHWRVGKAYKEQGKGKTAIKAFVNTLNALTISDGKELTCLILSDLVETVYEQIFMQKDDREACLATLREVSSALWPQLTYNFIVNLKWHMAEFVFRNCASPPTANSYNFDLSPFCNKDKLDDQRWVCSLLLWFLLAGADHRTLKFHIGDTYFHAAISIIVMSGCNPLIRNKPVDSEATQLLSFVLANKVIPANEMNIRDNKGNTVLHLLAMLKGPDKMREFLANYLLDHGVDVTATNWERKQAIELVSSSDVIRNALQVYLNKIKFIDKMKDQKKQDISGEQNSKQPKIQESIPRAVHSVQRKTQQCEACERRLEKVSDWLRNENFQEVFSNLVQVVNCRNNSLPYHKDMKDQAIEHIASLLASIKQDIPSPVMKLSAKNIKVVLTSLFNFGCWTQLEMLVTKFRQNKGQHSLPDFAKNMSLIDLIKDESLLTQKSTRMNLINIFMQGGAPVDAKSLTSALEAAMKCSEWQVVLKLLEHGADPCAMTLNAGDTPYHAALQVALNKQPGYFELLEKLKRLDDSKKATNLDVSCQDSDGNTLLHIAAQAKFTQHSLRAVELLCQWNVLADKCNKEEKLAIQYLPNDKDRRAQYLKRSIVGTMSTGYNYSVKKATGSSGNIEARLKTSQQSAQGTSWTALQTQREVMEDKLLALPDANYNFLTHDNRVKTKVEVVENVDSEDSEEEKEFQVASDPLIEIADVCETEIHPADLDIDVKDFDNLEWDIECTEDVWSVLRARKEISKGRRSEQSQEKKFRKEKMPHNLKQMIIKKVQQLASGDWGSHFQQQITDTPDSLQLFKIALPYGACILWELAIAFSPRLSESAETILADDPAEHFVVRGSKIYSELIRVWSIVLKHSELQHIVQKIIDSHERGKKCIIQKNLEVLNSQFRNTCSSKRLPMLYVEINLDKTNDADMKKGHQRHLFPPASAHKNEFHVLKFYSFSSSLVSAALNNSDANVDFPFRVTDIEHAVINLKSVSPLLLLGRSGTGKTTCCLYRMWRMFFQYWELAINCGTPMLQRRNYPPEVTDYEREIQESQTMKESKVATKLTVETSAHQDVDFMESCEAKSHKEDIGSENDSDDNNEECVEDTGIQYDHLHQLFVTKNPVLCKEVHKNFMKLCNGTEVMQKNNVCQNTDLPNTLQDVVEFSFPLFLTSRQLLLMLDASIDGNTFFPRDEDLALKVTIPGWGAQEDIFNIAPLEHDDLFDSSGDDDDVEKNSRQMRRVKHVHAMGARPLRKVFNRRECTYDVFAYEVWPKITKKAEIDCHPSLVWTEIMSFIKGSYESLHTEKGYLDKEQYLNIGRKRAPNFSANRNKVYDVFLGYQHYKQHHSLFDESDLVYNLYCRLRTMTFQPWILHEIYVDETQDFTQAELALLISLCSEPNKMFLTGDTAQSIMRGISFRFDDLRSLFFCVRDSADKSEQHLLSIKVPQKVHQLTHNYRSHTGILSLASSVLDILLELFRDSFDPLEKDQGMFAGPKPIIIESSSPGDLALLLTGSRRKTSHIEFGAHQAVLVVSERAKAELPEELGGGIVLTIFESKGLEFDDVLIYNFFKDSQAKKEWRVVTNFLRSFEETNVTNNSIDNLVEIDADVLTQSSRTRPLAFDPNQHKVLNSELKHLYTAITRARVNVWIFDEDEERRAPMFEYFRARGLVKCMGTEECANVNEAIMFADKSTTKEWKLAGDKYMYQKLYTVAAKCYRLAEQPNKERVALAYQTALEASRMGAPSKAMKDRFFVAGKQFVECGDLHHAAMCFQNSQDFLLSAIAFEKSGKFVEASNQYLRTQKANDASRCLEQVGMFGRAIRVLVDHENFDRAIDCLSRYEMEIQKLKREGRAVPAVLIENKPNDVHSEAHLCYRSANFHYSRGDMPKAIAAIKRLKNPDDQILLLQEKGFWEEAAEILEKEGKTEQAAQFMLRSGNTDKALEYAQEGFHRELRALIHLAIARRYESKEYSLEKIRENATKALNIYIELQDYNGQAQAKLLLGKHTNDAKQISAALRDFRNVKPPNQVAELECLIVFIEIRHGVSTMKHCQEVIQIITLGQNILDVLLNQKTENSDKYQLYLNFYGMELDSVRHQVTWYPNQYQPCKDFLNISSTGEKRKFEMLDEDIAVSALKKYLMSKIEKLAQMVQGWLEEQKFSHLPCIRMQEGQSCNDDCKYMHRPFESTQEEIGALNLLICSVNLDYCMHPHMEHLAAKRIEESDFQFANREESKWNSVEELLDFILPAYPSAQRSQHEHTQEIVKSLRIPKVQTQVERYFRYLWNNPGRVGKGLSTNVLKERCKSTRWIVQACFFASLLKLKLDVNAEVRNLEVKLMSTGARWAHKRYKYALFTGWSDKGLLIEAIGTRFLQSFIHLTKDQNALEALFPFTKMISTFGARNNLSLMPKLNHFIFWIEFYISLTWLFTAKVNQAVHNNKRFYMTNSYLFNLHILSACTDSDNQPSLKIPQLVVQHKLKYQDDRLILERQSFIINFLVGHNAFSDFSLINQVNQLCQAEPPNFRLAERIIILSAVVLLNIPDQYVYEKYEVPIRRELCKLSVTEVMPTRLASLVKSLKCSSNYHDVAEALFKYFHQQGCDRLILCQWLEKHSQPMKFFDAQLSDTPSLDFFFDADIEAEIEKTSINSHDKGEHFDRTNEEQDEVDVERQEAQKAETEQENRKKVAIKLIINFLQVKVMQSRLHRKAYRTFELEEMFKPFAMTATSCGICAQNLKPSETGTYEEGRVQQDLHYLDGKHVENFNSFTVLKSLYISQIHSSYQKILRFVCENKVEEKSPIYKDIELDTSKVLKAQQQFGSTLKDLLHSRKWGNGEALLKDFRSFEKMFTQHCQQIVTVYKEYKETREYNSRKATVKQKEHMEEILVDLDFNDPTLNETGFKSQLNKNQ